MSSQAIPKGGEVRCIFIYIIYIYNLYIYN